VIAPKLYHELAEWWPLVSPPADYADEASFYLRTLSQICVGDCRSVLELGSGGGNNAFHLKARFDLVLVDRSAGMLDVSRRLNPECEHIEADMRDVRLGREFDGVFVHDAICYMTTETDLRNVIGTAFAHCRPGGAALFAPDHVRESFQSSTDHGGEDGGQRALRYLEWTWDPEPDDTSYLVDYAYLLRDEDGSTRVVWDRHMEGLFGRMEWLRFLSDAGFEARVVPADHLAPASGQYEVFACRKPR
jgi:SAM-dependent methyltransferase